MVVAVVLGLRADVAMAVVVALVVGVVMVVAVVAALVVGVGVGVGVGVVGDVGVFLQAVWCVDLVVVASVCVTLAVAKATDAAFTLATAVLWVLAIGVWGGGGVKGLQRGGLKLPSTPSKKNRTKFTVTMYSDNVQ